MINEEILTEKLKYLMMMSSRPKFEILDFNIDFEYDNYENENKKIVSYSVDIKFDYHGRIDETPSSMGSDIENMMGDMNYYVGFHVITPEGKISKSYDSYVDEGVIWSIEYEFDEKQIFNTSFKVIYPD